MITPLERLSPRSVLGELRTASWEGPVGWPVLVIPAPWLFASQLFYSGQNGLGPAQALQVSAMASAVNLVALAALLWMVIPALKALFGLRSTLGLEMLFFALGGVAQATVAVTAIGVGHDFWERWAYLASSWALNTGIWTSSAAILVSWWRQAAQQRMELEAEYRRQLLTRREDARALAEADVELSEVRRSTHEALADIRRRLHPRMDADELGDCIAVIDEVVAGSVRPASHDLARLTTEIEPIPVETLWRGWRELVPAVVRTWPQARPFQAGLVGMLCLPMVMVADLVPSPHQYDAGTMIAMSVLAAHVALLFVLDRWLGTRIGRLGSRAGTSVVFAIYVMLYLFGLTMLLLASSWGAPAPLEAFLVPPLLATVGGGISAFARIRNEESAAARALIRRTSWEVHHTRQRLWARRRRLAMALHGRVQANLTAASLLLGMARNGLLAGEELDDAVIGRVSSTVELADLIDQASADDPRTRLLTVTTVWAGVLNVAVDLRPDGLRLLEANPDLTDACVEVVREVLLNAVRHSRATAAEVIIGADQGTLLCLRVTELVAARTPLGSIGGPGLGRTLIDSLAVDWAETDREEGRITVALLAAGTPGAGWVAARSRLSDVSMLT